MAILRPKIMWKKHETIGYKFECAFGNPYINTLLRIGMVPNLFYTGKVFLNNNNNNNNNIIINNKNNNNEKMFCHG